MAAEDVHVDNLATRRSTVLVSNGGGVGVGDAGGHNSDRRKQGRPACNPQSAKLAHLLLFSFQNPVGRDPLVDAGTSRASGATASSQGVCSLLEERIPALAPMINRDI